LPTSLSLGTHEVKVKVLDADYWTDNYPSYTGGDIDLDGNNPSQWPYCDFTISDNEKSTSITSARVMEQIHLFQNDVFSATKFSKMTVQDAYRHAIYTFMFSILT
jgi:hypothetical protein